MSDGMNAQDPLAQLRDIHLPESTGWWPLAWGWWLLLALLLIGAAVALYAWRARRRRQRYRQQALLELERAYAQFQRDDNTSRYLQSLSELLRRAALTALPSRQQPQIATLTGEAWLTFLDRSLPDSRHEFARGAGRALLSGPYQPNPVADVETLHSLGQRWLKHHLIRLPKTGADTSTTPGGREATHHA